MGGKSIGRDGLGSCMVLMQVFAVGKKLYPCFTSTNSMEGCKVKPSTGSSVEPVANCNTFCREINSLLPPVKKASIKLFTELNEFLSICKYTTCINSSSFFY